MSRLWDEDLHLSEETTDADRSSEEMGNGVHEQKRSILVDCGSSNRGRAGFQLDVDERIDDLSLMLWNQSGERQRENGLEIVLIM